MNLRHRLPACKIDASHLETALLDIVVNARDAMPDGGTVTITTSKIHLNGDAAARELPSGDYVTLSVTDEGIGMEPSVIARAVEPFFTTKGVGRGTGLGLVMVHGFLQQSRGRLELESKLGRGTTVRMILPIHGEGADAVALSAARTPVAAARASEQTKGEGQTILMVEDSDDVRALAREPLVDPGCRVLTPRSQGTFSYWPPICAHSTS